MRLENLWVGTATEDSLRAKKKQYVGTEKVSVKELNKDMAIFDRSPLLKEVFAQILTKDSKRAYIVKKFFEDMDINLAKVYEALESGGHYIIVIGNSVIRSVNIESWKILNQIASYRHFKHVLDFSYIIQNPYIRIPRKGRGGKINEDYVLVLRKE